MQLRYFLVVLYCICLATPVFAPPTPPSVPIDGGIGFLFAAGAAYGVKKAYERRRKKNER